MDEAHRLSDADREQTVVYLREHLLAGRLTLDEFSDRVEIVYGARFGPEEMCDIQWSCTAAYYSWLDAHLDFKAGGSGSKARSRPTPFDDMRNWGR